MQGGEPFAFGGLWDRWQSPEGRIDTCTIITTTGTDTIDVIHDRMPVILDAEGNDAGFNPKRSGEVLLALLVPVAPDRIAAQPVSTRVNDVRHAGSAYATPMSG